MQAEYRVNYARPGSSHSFDQTQPGPGNEQLIDAIDSRVVRVKNGRCEHQEYTLDEQGFELTKVAFEFSDYEHNDRIQNILYPNVVDWLQSKLGASDVKVFDHTYRSKQRSELSIHNRAPVKTVHNDYTAHSANHRLLEETTSEPQLRSKPFQLINLWIPVHHTVEESPLAMVDLRTVSEKDYHPLKLIYPDRIGELAAISYNPDHDWVYFSQMEPGEAILLKVFDSQVNRLPNGVPHSALDDIEPKAFKHLRSSLELRTIVFFEEG